MTDPTEVPHESESEKEPRPVWPNPSWRELLHELRVHLDDRLDQIDEDINHRFSGINEKLHQLKEIELMAQSDVDALTASLQGLKDTLVADDGAIQAAIAALEAQVAAGQPVDLTALQTAVADMSAAVDSTTALVPPAVA